MKSKFTTDNGILLNIGDRIAKGGEGEVFEIINIPGMLFKSYYSGMRSNERMNKLKYMCSNKPLDISSEKFRICWPNEIVYENGEFAGFIMQKAFDLSITPYHLCQLTIPDKFSKYWKTTYDRSNIQGRINRLMLSANIAAAMHRIHTSGKYIIADFKPQNLLITVEGKVSLIDMDSVQVYDYNTILFKAPVSTPEYTPPEAKKILKSGKPITESWDSFSFGILIYEILCGIHPYTGTAHPPFDNHSTIAEKIENNLTYLAADKSIFKVLPPPHSNFDVFSPTLQNLIKSIFQNGQSSNNRPSIKLIGDALAKEVQYTLAQKEKLEVQNALGNYRQAVKQIENLKNIIEVLNSEISDKDNKLESNKEKINSWRMGFFFTLIIGVFIIFMIVLGQNQNLNSNNTNYQGLNDKLISEKNDLLAENAGLKSRISQITAENNRIKGIDKSFGNNNSSPISLKNIAFCTSKNDTYLSDYGASLRLKNCFYIMPKIDYVGITPGVYDIYVKIIDPNGKLSVGGDSPNGFTYVHNTIISKGENTMYLLGWGNDIDVIYIPGTYKFEIWINGINIKTTNFVIYDW